MPAPPQLLLGPPGSGKSQRLLASLSAALARPDADPARMLLILPSQSAVQATRQALLQSAPTRGFAALPLTPIARLPERLGVPGVERLLSPLHERLLIEQAWRESGGGPLGALAGLPWQPGLVEGVRAQISECQGMGYLPDRPGSGEEGLRAFPWNRFTPAQHWNAPLLAEFQAVWRAYEHLKRAGEWCDEADLLRMSCRALQQRDLTLALDWLGMDGFTELTALQWQLLRALILGAPRAQVLVTCALDRPFASPLAPIRDEADPRAWWVGAMRHEELFVDVPLSESLRATTPGLQALGEQLPAVLDGEGGAPLSETSGIELWRPWNRAREVDRVLRDIALRVHAGGAWSGHVVLVRALEPYRTLLERSARELDIPLEIPGRITLYFEPLAKRWLALVRLLEGRDWEQSVVWSILAAPLAPGQALTMAQVGQFARWFDARPACNGLAAWRESCPELPLPRARALLSDLLARHDTFQTADPPTRLELAIALLDAWVLEPAVRQAAAAADPRDAPGATLAALCGAAEALRLLSVQAPERLALDTSALLFRALLEQQIDAPAARCDAVLVLDVNRARAIEAEQVYLLGLVAGEFPQQPAAPLIFSAEQRDELSVEQRESGAGRHPVAGAWSRPDWRTEATMRATEEWLFQVACTRARERLVLSAPLHEGDRDLLPSPWFERIDVLYGREAQADQSAHALPPLAEWVHPRDARRYRQAFAAPGARGMHSPLWRQLDPASSRADRADLLARLEGRDDPCPPRIETPAVLPLGYDLTRTHAASVSRLNDLVQCPFKFFAKHGCHLEPLDEPYPTGLELTKQGELVHAALEAWIQAGCPRDEPAIAQLWTRVLVESGFGVSAELPPIVQHQLLRAGEALQHTIAFETERGWPWVQSGARIAEFAFGGESGPPFAIAVPGFEPLAFQGRIDRIDRVRYGEREWLVLFDYKYSAKGLNDRRKDAAKLTDDEAEVPVSLLDLDLQLPVYCLAAAELLGIPPLAAFLFPLLKPAEVRYGFLDSGAGWAIRDALGPPSKPVDLPLPAEDALESLRATVEQRLAQLLGRLRSNDIARQPLLASRCGPRGCDYLDVCRFEEFVPGAWR